jgi:hypothetical protein
MLTVLLWVLFIVVGTPLLLFFLACCLLGVAGGIDCMRIEEAVGLIIALASAGCACGFCLAWYRILCELMGWPIPFLGG